MRQRILVLGLLAVLATGALVIYSNAGRPAKTASATVNSVSGASSEMWSIDSPNMREVGQESASVPEAEGRISRKAKLPDEKITGGKPMIRTDEDTLILIYPNDIVVTALPWMWPGRDPRQHYAEFVKNENADPSSWGPESWSKNQLGGPAERVVNQLIDVVGNPGYRGESGNNLIDGKLIPRPAYIIWTQDGIEFRVFGSAKMKLAQIVPIAESVAKSN